MKQFKIRASATAKIMTEPKDKTQSLSVGAKSYCDDWIKEQLYSRKKEFSSKTTAKGSLMEDEAIELASLHLGWGLVYKNEEEYSNDFATGTPDLVFPDFIPDIKCSTDCFTFPLLEKELPNKDYYWQVQTYLWLTGRPKGAVVYCLMNDPEFMIESKAWQICRNYGNTELDMDVYESVRERCTYDSVHHSLRLKQYHIERNEDDIKRIEQKVIACREYIKSVLPEKPASIFFA